MLEVLDADPFFLVTKCTVIPVRVSEYISGCPGISSGYGS